MAIHAAFNELRELREWPNSCLGGAARPFYGMSGDFERRPAAGSTMLRLGQALFVPP